MKTLAQLKREQIITETARKKQVRLNEILEKRRVSGIVNEKGESFVKEIERAILYNHSWNLDFRFSDFSNIDEPSSDMFISMEKLVREAVTTLCKKLQKEMIRAGHGQWLLTIYDHEKGYRHMADFLCGVEIKKKEK